MYFRLILTVFVCWNICSTQRLLQYCLHLYGEWLYRLRLCAYDQKVIGLSPSLDQSHVCRPLTPSFRGAA